MTEAFVTPALVKWARERNNLTADAVAEKLNVAVAKFTAWERGDERPTLRQAQNLAQKLYVPFGFLFLSEPPSEDIPLPDLRTVTGAPLRPPSPAFLDLVYDVLRKQQWYREYQEDEGAESIPFIGRFALTDGVQTIASDIVNTLGINNVMRQESPNWEGFLREFIRRAERSRILVLRSSIVENNNYRKLDVQEFRGFAISDDLAPLVFINARDWKTAQIFTLAHEVAHLWIGESGVSNLDYRQPSWQQENHIDRKCDQIAAEILVPNSDFEVRWQDDEEVGTNLDKLAPHYRVSKFVVLRRAYENKKFSSQEYRVHYEDLMARITPKGTESGGDFHRTLLARNSSTFTLTLLAAAAEGRLSERDAARLLNVKVRTVGDVRNRLFAGELGYA
ncbi:MAG: ImmA/IrrE family metallo-endopeptidase [Dehalococcoidia bacterium]|nr:MAG: ImmA/IrrE family metallo-endopeptidase [Dehalococcoidia bacterium]